MYHTTLILILSLSTLHLTNTCWAQEPTPTTDTPGIITPIPLIHVTTIEGSTTDVIGEPTTFALSETIPVTIETFSSDFPSESLSSHLASETTLIHVPPEPSAHGSLPESTSLDPISTPTSDFTITLDPDIYDDCNKISITWSGTDISSPYRIYYSTGIGDIKKASNFDPETEVFSGDWTSYVWFGPLSQPVSHGNVIRFTVVENGGRNVTGNIQWKSQGPCMGVVVSGEPDHIVTMGPEIEEEISYSRPDITEPVKGTGTRDSVPSLTQISDEHMRSSIGTTIRTCTDEPVVTSRPNPITIMTHIPATITRISPIRTIPPVANIHTGNAPRLSGENHSPGNPLRPFAPLQSTPQVLNTEDQKPPDELETTTLISVGDSTTLTIVTGAPRRTSPISTGSGVQQYSVPAVTATLGGNNAARSGLPPAVISVIVGSLLGALTLWILFIVWLNKRKRARGFKELDDPVPSTRANGITPFVAPPPAVHNPVYRPDFKRRVTPEVERPVSPVTSIADTGTHSELHAAFMTETLSEDLYSIASSPDPIRGPSGSHKSAKDLRGTQGESSTQLSSGTSPSVGSVLSLSN